MSLSADERRVLLRSVLGRDKRLLRRIGEAGELVRRRRRTTDEEYCTILATGDPAGDTIEEWVAPRRTAPALGYPVLVCDGCSLAGLVDRGLVILLAGGTRAVLTGAGQWCAGEPCEHCEGSGLTASNYPVSGEVDVCLVCSGEGHIAVAPSSDSEGARQSRGSPVSGTRCWRRRTG